MFVYRVYSLDYHGRLSFGEEIRADDDQAALALARELLPHVTKCEIWEGRRLVATLNDEGWTTHPA